jgi:hypothetical protein
MSFVLKDPEAVLDYQFDWGADYLGDGDLLAASEWAVDPDEADGMSVVGSGFDASTSTVKVGGGTASAAKAASRPRPLRQLLRVRRAGRGGGGARVVVRAGRTRGGRRAEAARDCGAVRPSVEGAGRGDHAGAYRRRGRGEGIGEDHARAEAGSLADSSGQMSERFGDAAVRLSRTVSLLLGWRPNELWECTPMELCRRTVGPSRGNEFRSLHDQRASV